MSVTRQNIKDFFYETVGDTEAAQAFFVEDDVTAWANEALREAVERTEFADYHEDQSSTAATALVTLSSANAIGLWRVEYEGEKLGKLLQAFLPEIAIAYQDEMFTTKMAQHNLIERGMKNVSKHDDEEAARIILQEWLDRMGRE